MKEDSILENIESLIDDTGKYIEAKTELWKLKTVDKLSDSVSSIASQVIFLFIISIVIMSLNVGLAIMIGSWLGQIYFGFFVIAGFYTLIGLILYVFRNKIIKTPLYNNIINKILK
ncbi:MAG: hypothetical protein JST63_04745 [Bacteroidetes bacterium]|nr:hypothetical protein [Bacteroidota bacterium]